VETRNYIWHPKMIYCSQGHGVWNREEAVTSSSYSHALGFIGKKLVLFFKEILCGYI